MSSPIATFEYTAGAQDAALEFLKRTRWELRSLRFVRVWRYKLAIFDINNDSFEIRGIGYADADMAPLLAAVNTAFDPATLANETSLEFKEYKTGRRHPWAQDRVM